MKLWYMSFASDAGFLGAVMVMANNAVHAAERAWELGINPGGEVMALPVPDGVEVPPEFRDRLLSREDIGRLDGKPPKSLNDIGGIDPELIEQIADSFCKHENERLQK